MKILFAIMVLVTFVGCASEIPLFVSETGFISTAPFRGSVVVVKEVKADSNSLHYPSVLRQAAQIREKAGHSALPYRVLIERRNGTMQIIEPIEATIGLYAVMTNCIGKKHLTLPEDLYGEYWDAKRRGSQRSAAPFPSEGAPSEGR